ncbi:MAG TPA: ABC transporter substrate-binding protein [Casimicrobiaceae bacterium]|nr:ABC transporter substrate-binding protein [Casimicrobiaceae bacterium]
MISNVWRRATCFALALAAGLATLPAFGEESVNLALDWVVNGTHAGYYVAREKGFYKDAGLDVAISRGFGSGDTIKRVASKSAQFGIADTGAVIAARANDDLPVRIVAMIYDRATLGLIYLAESGIRKPKDIEGRAIGRTASGASVNMFPGFLKANGIDRSKIREVVVDGATFAPLLLSGKVDAVLEQSINIGKFRRAAAEQGKHALAMSYADYGLTAYGNAVVVNPDMLRDKPDVVRGFVAASLKGMAYAFAHPDEAIAILRKSNPEVGADTAMDELVTLKEMETTPALQKAGLGTIDVARLEKTRDIVTEALSLRHKVSVEDLYAPGFLPKTPVLP